MRMRQVAVGFAIAAVCVVTVVGWGAYGLYHQNWALVRHLRLGMTPAEVAEAFGREADCSTTVGRSTVSYFFDRAWPEMGDCKQLAPRYAAMSDIPGPYSAVAVAYDRDQHVSAFAHLGESVLVTRTVQKPLATFHTLPIEAIE